MSCTEKRNNWVKFNPTSNQPSLCAVMSGFYSHRAFHVQVSAAQTAWVDLMRKWVAYGIVLVWVCFSRRTAQVTLTRPTDPSTLSLRGAPAVQKHPSSFKMHHPLVCAVHRSDCDEAPQFQDDRLPSKTKTKVQMFLDEWYVQDANLPAEPERRGACMSVHDRHRPDVSAFVLPGVWLSGRTKDFL